MSFKSILSVAVVFASASVYAAAATTTTTTTTTTTAAPAATAAKAATTTATTTTAATTATTTALPKADVKAVDYSIITLADDKKPMTVKGPVAATFCDANICAINFHTDYKKFVSIVIEKKDFVNFAKIPGADMKAKMDWYKAQGAVQVTGTVKKYDGKSGSRPQIMATAPTDIKPVSL